MLVSVFKISLYTYFETGVTSSFSHHSLYSLYSLQILKGWITVILVWGSTYAMIFNPWFWGYMLSSFLVESCLSFIPRFIWRPFTWIAVFTFGVFTIFWDVESGQVELLTNIFILTINTIHKFSWAATLAFKVWPISLIWIEISDGFVMERSLFDIYVHIYNQSSM